MKTRKIQVRVTRTETWWPEYEVPDHMTDGEAEDHINAEVPGEIFDEYLHKYTLNTEQYCEVMPYFLQ